MRYLDNGMIIVESSSELRKIVTENKIKLELIDIKGSELQNLDSVFYDIHEINGSIENWDISDIKKMSYTFCKSSLNLDLSKWDVSNVKRMYATFSASKFNNDSLKNWDFSKCESLDFLFYESEFCGDISNLKFNEDVFCSFYGFVNRNDNFKNKYNAGKKIPEDTHEFKEWFEANRKNMTNLNISKEELIELDDYLSNFEIKELKND